MDEAVRQPPFFHHHAHLLAHPGRRLPPGRGADRIPGVGAADPYHLTWLRAQHDLVNAPATTRGLLDGCRFEATLVEDGYRLPGAMTIDEHAVAVGCPVERIVRIETVAEGAAADWPPWSRRRERFREAVTTSLSAGAAALKTIAAYRCGLDLPPPDNQTAAAAYHRWRQTRSRLEAPELVSWFLAESLDVPRTDPHPLQVQTGIGDAACRCTDPTPPCSTRS